MTMYSIIRSIQTIFASTSAIHPMFCWWRSWKAKWSAWLRAPLSGIRTKRNRCSSTRWESLFGTNVADLELCLLQRFCNGPEVKVALRRGLRLNRTISPPGHFTGPQAELKATQPASFTVTVWPVRIARLKTIRLASWRGCAEQPPS